MSGSESVSAEGWSTILVQGGIALMIATAVLGVVSIIFLYYREKRLNTQLEAEFGKKRH